MNRILNKLKRKPFSRETTLTSLWQNVLYPLAFFITILTGVTYFVFHGQAHRRVSTLVEHRFIAQALFVAEQEPRAAITAEEHLGIVLELPASKRHHTELMDRVLNLEKDRPSMEIYIDSQMLSEEKSFARTFHMLSGDSKIKLFVKTPTFAHVDSDSIYEIQYCAETNQLICPYYPKAKKWNVQHLFETYHRHQADVDSPASLAENLGSNFPSYLLRIPETRIVQTDIASFQAIVSEHSTPVKTLFIQLKDSFNKEPVIHLPSLGRSRPAEPVEFWSGVAALAKSGSFPAIATKSTEWLVAILFLGLIVFVSLILGFIEGFLIFLSTLILVPLFSILLLRFFNFYLPIFLIEYVLLMSFLGLGFFLSASENLIQWIQNTRENLSNETNDLIENFISLISHNLNTPVAKTIGLLDVLERMALPPNSSKSAEARVKKSLQEAMLTSTQIQLNVKNTLANTKLEVAQFSNQPVLLSEARKDLDLKMRPILKRLGFELLILDLQDSEVNAIWNLPFHPSFLENLFLAVASVMLKNSDGRGELHLLLGKDGYCTLELKNEVISTDKDSLLSLTGQRILDRFINLELIKMDRLPVNKSCVFTVACMRID